MVVGMVRGSAAAAVLLALVLPSARGDGPVKTGFVDRVYADPSGETEKYVVFVPHAYQGEKDYPLILFLHGSGETGSDGKKQVTVGIGPVVKKKAKEFPAIVVFPQAHIPNLIGSIGGIEAGGVQEIPDHLVTNANRSSNEKLSPLNETRP